MHSQKKIPKDEAKEQERMAKAKKYHAALSKFLSLKKSHSYELALIKDLGNLLRIGPEFGTLWNYRKEILIAFKQSIDECQDETEKAKMIVEFDKMCKNELSFIVESLYSSPKCYSTWHHRVWLIQFMNNPDINQELEFCNKCLEMDERNFHCWNYRRFIVKYANISTLDEFEFTSKKIKTNFSNFSSWHYRSHLFEQLVQENYDKYKLKSMIDKDFQSVKNAIYTDPNDQSPWLYLRWLLDFENSILYPIQKSKSNIEKLLLLKNFDDQTYRLIVEFTNPSRMQPTLYLKINNQQLKLSNWKCLCNGSIWSAMVDGHLELNHQREQSISHEICLTHERETIRQAFVVDDNQPNGYLCFIYQQHRNQEDIQKRNILNRIEDLKILLELEHTSKWPHYMLSKLGCLNIDMDTLIQMDPLRTNYYNDIRSKEILKQKLQHVVNNQHCELINLNLHSLHFMNNLMHVQYLNLSSNQLIKFSGNTLEPLINLRCLIMDHNQIYICDTKNLHLDSLVILSLKYNKIDDYQDLKNVLEISPKLKHINLIGNPLKLSDEVEFKNPTTGEMIEVYFDNEKASQIESIIEEEFKMIQNCKAIFGVPIIDNDSRAS